MLELCLAPVLLIGLALPLDINPRHVTALENSPIVELHTCNTGLGAHARAARNGIYTVGIDYGVTKAYQGFEFSLIPQVGLSYVDHDSRNLPARTQYEVGAQAMVCYDHYCSSVGYIHLSNGDKLGLCWSGSHCRPNSGEDLFTLTTGVRF